MEEKKNGEGKDLEKENIFFCGGDGKGEKFLRKCSSCRGEEELRRNRRNLFGEGKLMVTSTN